MSDSIIITAGAVVGHEGRRYRITHLLDLENVLAKDEETGVTERLAIKDLTLPPRVETVGEGEGGRGETELVLVPDEDWQEAQTILRQRVQARDENSLNVVRKGQRLSFNAWADLFLEKQHAVEQSLSRRRATRHINVDRNDAVAAAYH